MGWHGQSLLVCMCVENESNVRPSTRVPRTLADIGRPALPSTYKHTPRSFWAHPDVPPAWNPRRGHLQFRGDQDAMVRAPAPSLLRNAVFQHSHPRTKEAPNDRLNHACPKVEAFKARRAVEGLHEGGLVEG